MVHASIAYAKQKNRLQTFVCTASVGPGSTNMVTGAATATINRLPVLLLPGDVFATRRVDPVLQQLEFPGAGDVSVNDTLRPVSRYFDRITRPEQLLPAALEAMRVLTDPAETGAVTLALPQDVQAEAWNWPAAFFAPRTWHVQRTFPQNLATVMEAIAAARRPLIVAGGGVLYSEASAALASFVEQTGIPVVETQAGKGSLAFDHPNNLGAAGATGTLGANRMMRDADLVIGIGTRYSDFTTASRTAFANADVRFININVASFDAHKLNALPVVGDARAVLEILCQLDYRVADDYTREVTNFKRDWEVEVDRIYALNHAPLPSQGEVIGAVNAAAAPRDVVVCAAGSLPGDLHKLWRTRDPRGYHVEYGYSCMGYEVAGGIGVRMADPTREVYVLVGDGSWLMMSSEIVTAVQEGIKITVVLIDNHGYGSIGGLSESLGSGGFGTRYRYRAGVTAGVGESSNGASSAGGQLDGDVLPIDLAANAASLGAHVIPTSTIGELSAALAEAREVQDRPVVITIECDPTARVPGYDSWWDVPIAEVSAMAPVQDARREYEAHVARERWHV